jgi:hypothetical protein
MSKKILYLLGSGASEAVLRHLGSPDGLLPRNVQEKIGTYSNKNFDPVVWDELTSPVGDVEHLVSVLDSQLNYATAERVRRLYQRAILELSRPFSSPPRNNLYAVLLDYHLGLDEKLTGETLSGFLTLNYEDLLESTILLHFQQYDVDYGVSTDAANQQLENVRVYKLHGSFNWVNSRPIRVQPMQQVGIGNALWIPPGVEKRKDNYPFNLLWGRVLEELMACDVLRIVGCSLSRNDWGLIPILYTIQRFARRTNPMYLQIVDFPSVADTIKANYPYLRENIESLVDLKEILKYFKREFPRIRKPGLRRELERTSFSPFRQWLEAKIDNILAANGSIDTDRQILRKFHYREL